MKSKTILLIIALTYGLIPARAQDNSSDSNGQVPMPNSPAGGTESLLFTGSGATMFSASKDGNTFMPMTLMMMPLVHINNRLFLESGVKMELQENGDFGFHLEVLNLHYKINDWMSFHIGKFPANWGNILDMFGEGFVSRFATSPIGMSDDGMAPTDQLGMGFQGGIQTGSSKMLYDIYVSNGPQLIVDEASEMAGHLTYDPFVDNNKNKAIGGKIGILPFSNSSLQVDVFGQTAAKTGDPGSAYENVGSTSYGVDLNFYKTFNPILIRIMGQYENTKTQNANYFQESTSTFYTFNNEGNTWYMAGTLRPSGSGNKFISNLELGVRYTKYTPPIDAVWGGDPANQTSLDLTYWFTWDNPINLTYDIINEGGQKNSAIVIRAIHRF